MDNQQIWQAALGELEILLSKANFTTWFKQTTIVDQNEGEVTIGVPNSFAREWLQNKYQKQIAQVLQNITNTRIRKISYELNAQANTEKRNAVLLKQQEEVKTVSTAPLIPSQKNEFGLNPKYTFAGFIVGTSNELARAAAAAVSQNPGSTYNPLFIYGGVGLGKTHLVQAVGNQIIAKNPNAKIVYATCEKFTNDFIAFIRNEKGKVGPPTFKNKYRSADVLIIDDVQFLSGKESTQDQFFHTFNALYQENKQIILTADRPPKALASLTDRLISRFEGGMVADISLPDQETRRAILQSKCLEKGMNLPEDVLVYLAENIQNNIRELEGALSRLLAHCEINKLEPSPEIAKAVLSNVLSRPKTKAITPRKIVAIVSSFYDLDPKLLMAKNRKKEVAWPRQIAMFLMREEAKTSYPTIGQELGGRDHTTAMHAYEKVSKAIERDNNFRQEIDLLRQKIYTAP